MKTTLLSAAVALTLAIGADFAQAENAAFTDHVVNSTSRGVAIDGFDPVAYFTQGAPAKGDRTIRHEYKDRVWLFSSAENRDLFAANPDKYAPQNNGWCSWAVAHEYAAEADFVNGWFIVDDKLYVTWSADVKERFLKDQDNLISQSHANWSTVHAGLQDGSLDKFGFHSSRPALGISHPQQLPETDS